VIDWLGPLDSTQHAHGVGSPEAKDALRRIDESIGRTIVKLEALGRLNRTDIIVTSDHGFAYHNHGVDLVSRLIAAGLKANRTSTDLVVASQSQSLLFYLPPANVEPLVRFLQREPSVDLIFTRGGSDGRGSVSGTFSLGLIGADHGSRAADVIATLAWTSDANPHGVPGAHTVNGAASGPLTGAASGHGGLNPWVVRNTFVARGPDIQGPRRFDAPMSLADVTPTVLALFGIKPPSGAGRGRVLDELITRAGPATRVTQRTMETRVDAYRATIVISSVSGHDYVDSGSRQR
jgi:arylsulfatase A-like enzyme